MSDKFKTIQMRRVIYDRAVNLRDDLTQMSDGRTISLSETVARALACLADAHKRGAWLSPAEALPMYEQSLIDLLVATAGQVAAVMMANPGAKLIRCETHAAEKKLMLVFDTGASELVGLPLLLPASLFGARAGESVQ